MMQRQAWAVARGVKMALREEPASAREYEAITTSPEEAQALAYRAGKAYRMRLARQMADHLL